ncbi:MAG: N-acetylglutamate synthase [Methanosaeta sp. PtaU1.Bin060]|jgi:L-amino acid N-acyltransferase YncA|nr:MAG: N-acetylglutamate synthase [Methanosaeta sp. PtaU1.Bin060]
MFFKLDEVSAEDGDQVIDLFNYYVAKSFAAYPESKVPSEFFQSLLSLTRGYPFLVARDQNGRVVGFGCLRPYSPISTFSQAAEITNFVSSEHVGKGIGQMILDRLLQDAKNMGIAIILASISSLNSQSIAFHKKNGFVECGRFVGIGRKMGREFDVVWMQRGV